MKHTHLTKRTNLIVNKELLESATRLFGVNTYSEAVNRALEESIRIMKSRRVLDFMGMGVWEGDLSEMREDKNRK